MGISKTTRTMKKEVLFYILAILIIVFLPGILSMGLKLIPGKIQPSLDITRKIYGKYVVAEPFLATRNNLSAIGTSIKNPNLKNIDDVVISIFDESGNFLQESVVNGRNIPDGDFIKFKFSPIKDSKNKMYTIILSSKSKDGINPVEIFYTNQYPVSEKISDNLIVCEDELSGKMVISSIDKSDCKIVEVINNNGLTLSFVDFYSNSNFFSVVFDIYSQMFNRLIADTTFFVIYSITILILIAWSSYIYLPKLFSQRS